MTLGKTVCAVQQTAPLAIKASRWGVEASFRASGRSPPTLTIKTIETGGGEGVGVAVGVAVAVGVGVAVGVSVAVGVAVGVGVSDGTRDGVNVGTRVGVGLAQDTSNPNTITITTNH